MTFEVPGLHYTQGMPPTGRGTGSAGQSTPQSEENAHDQHERGAECEPDGDGPEQVPGFCPQGLGPQCHGAEWERVGRVVQAVLGLGLGTGGGLKALRK